MTTCIHVYVYFATRTYYEYNVQCVTKSSRCNSHVYCLATSGEVACLALGGGGGGGGGGGKYTDCRPPLRHAHTHTHTNTHAAFLSEFLISLQRRMQDFGEEGVGSAWIIDVSTTAKGKRAKIFVVRVLIFPQIVLETKAINTNK